ncbi:VQ motif-containing protein 17-like [Zingiber officinale]|uniref:VQ domain-containing protein n=1 Tax=Zingiber officinale TaxID=94328 RepID=A0A8J5FZH2_ZINOF|nr:VQ motif-containing protein 17-like [Zingiber officinale]KAG6495104.1 hypothetical protein ZIOFF_042895 [Zingiber officinale]
MSQAAARDKPVSLARTKRKVRIVHIFTPEIIKTDTENFSALVQQLTGKHSKQRRTKLKAIVKSRSPLSSTTIAGELLLHQEETTAARPSSHGMLKDESFCGGLSSGFGDAAEGAMFQDFDMCH